MYARIAGGRLPGFAVALILAALVTAGLFTIMERLVKPPRTAPQAPLPLTVQWRGRIAVPKPHVHRLTRRPPPPAAPPAAPRYASPGLRARVRRPAIAPSPVPPSARFPPASTAPPWHRGHIDWAAPLHRYLQEGAAKRFLPPVLPPRPRSVYDIPRRMRLSTGGEVDRIGLRCYATLFDIAYNDEASGNPALARVMHAMLPLFAHAVPCRPGFDDSFARDLLERLRARGYRGTRP